MMKSMVKLTGGILLLLMACGYMSWEYNRSVHGVEFEKIRYAVNDQDTLCVIGKLKHNTIIEGYPCASDWAHFTGDWKLTLLRLSDSATIQNISFAEDTWILFRNGRLMAVFPKDTEIQGHLCRGGGGPKGITTSFYPDGKLQSFFAPNDVKIGPIVCRGSVMHQIVLHANGSLKQATLANEQTIHG
ncbi:MAG: hypothetical protein KBA26_06525, partial [Candidatus Delongbacteria bacterium]|nr:hypothetical protein [Candidatus Delongbacteria bacterium]